MQKFFGLRKTLCQCGKNLALYWEKPLKNLTSTAFEYIIILVELNISDGEGNSNPA